MLHAVLTVQHSESRSEASQTACYQKALGQPTLAAKHVLQCKLCTSCNAGSWQVGQWDHHSLRMKIMLMTTFLTGRKVLYCQFWGCGKPPPHQSRCADTHFNKVLPLSPCLSCILHSFVQYCAVNLYASHFFTVNAYMTGYRCKAAARGA